MFSRYYSGELKAPVLTIFIGGNHEASNHLQELAYGGWVAPKIYYLGYAGVININGLRIGGISGIYRSYNYHKGHYEICPYDNNTVRTVYSMRNFEVFRMMQLTPSKIDIMLSHDWPQGIWEHGDNSTRFGSLHSLLRLKPDFKTDMDSGKLGNPPCMQILKKLKPKHWFSAHMHCRFDAIVKHEDGEATKFVALDKCIPGRNCFDFIELGDEVERDENGMAILDIKYDPEWLTILKLTNNFLNCTTSDTRLPYPPSPNKQSDEEPPRWIFTPTEDEIEECLKKFGNDLNLKENFRQTVGPYQPYWDKIDVNRLKQPEAEQNVQTQEFCDRLGIDDPLIITGMRNNVKVRVPNYSMSDQDAFKDNTRIVSDQKLSCHRQKLSLPKPLNDDEINLDALLDDEEDPKEEVQVTEVKDCAVVEDPPVTSNELIEEPLKTEAQPALKKFKRRNQEFYNSTDE